MKTVLVGYINPEESLIDITVEYNRIEAQIKSLLNTAPWTIHVQSDFADFKRQQRALLKQRDELFTPAVKHIGFNEPVVGFLGIAHCFMSNI